MPWDECGKSGAVLAWHDQQNGARRVWLQPVLRQSQSNNVSLPYADGSNLGRTAPDNLVERRPAVGSGRRRRHAVHVMARGELETD